MNLDIMLIIQGLLLTAGAVVIFAAIVYGGNIILDQDKLHRSLRLKKNHKFLEFTIFKICAYVLIAYWCILGLMQNWGAPERFIDGYRWAVEQGTRFYGIQIIPMRLIIALMVYAGIQMAWKYALVYFSKSDKYDPDADTQVVLTSLLSYIVGAIAILCGLLVSGVDFTGVAIVAGALSVGIGFGLQNIVNNFVAGIIILLENTIKPGDRVLIKGQEGFVRKISFRYTRIETLMKEDVIIPNADIITTPIINFEFDNKLAKVKCYFGVSYKADLDLVKETLINSALKHAEVLHDPINKPMVFINDFGESNINFELSCVITDVNKKHTVTSDLYFIVARAFKENEIEMAYPQRDVRIIQET